MNSTYRKDNHLFFKSIDLGDILIIDTNDYEEIIRYINSTFIRKIMINDVFFKIYSLDFLAETESIQSLSILQNDLDLTPVENLKSLKELSVADNNAVLHVSKIKNLEVLSIIYNKNIHGIGDSKKLKKLSLYNYKKENLVDLKNLENLASLFLYRPSIINLVGIEGMRNLKELHIDSSNKLESLNGIPINSGLECIDIYSAKKLIDYHPISNAKSLKLLRLTKTGDINNILFLKNLEHLQQVALGSKVIDGNLNLLRNIPQVSFKDYPHYNFKMKGFK